MNIQELEGKRIAVLLSGGVDSSVVVYEFARLGLHPDCFYIKIGPEEKEDWDCNSEEDLDMALYCKAMLTPTPNNTPPTTQARKGSSENNGCPAKTSRNTDVEKANTSTAKIVLTQNFQPNIFNATKSSMPLIVR